MTSGRPQRRDKRRQKKKNSLHIALVVPSSIHQTGVRSKEDPLRNDLPHPHPLCLARPLAYVVAFPREKIKKERERTMQGETKFLLTTNCANSTYTCFSSLGRGVLICPGQEGEEVVSPGD